MKPFITPDFLLDTAAGRSLFHGHAENAAIFDYHSHLPVSEIASDRKFENLTQAWLAGDHYKWRAMRANGVEERFITGDAGDREKFLKWAETVPYTLRNPLFHWTHLELRLFFGINDRLLGPETAEGIYEETAALLRTEKLSVRNILRGRNVRAVCTTDDPCDDLAHHRRLAADGFEVKVLPTFRPDKAMQVGDGRFYKKWIETLEKVSSQSIGSLKDLLAVLDARHAYFHDAGCRISDHGLETVPAVDCSASEADKIFRTARSGKDCGRSETEKFGVFLLAEFGRMDHSRGWTQQLHLGVMRNNNSRLAAALGPDTGFDSIGDFRHARGLAGLLDRLDREGRLPRTVLYNINPSDNEIFATLAGNFSEPGNPGKIQFGSAWWFLDQKDGMERHLNALSNLGLLSRFVGMLTDSRSFLSYSRHDYFRRVLCGLLGREMSLGVLPDDERLVGKMVEDICFNNAAAYFGIPV